MTGIEYMNNVCPTTSNGRDPNMEDVADAFEDGIAEGFKQCKRQMIQKACVWLKKNTGFFKEKDFRKAMED
jgi:hypothetical protein